MNKRWKWSVWANWYGNTSETMVWNYSDLFISSFVPYHDVCMCMDICWKWIQLLFYELLFCFDFDMKNMHLTALLVLDVRVTQITNPNTFVSTIICLKSSNNCRVFFLPSFSAFLGYQLMFLPISLFMVLRLSFQLIEHHINKALSFDHN